MEKHCGMHSYWDREYPIWDVCGINRNSNKHEACSRFEWYPLSLGALKLGDASLQVIANLCHIKGSVGVGDTSESTEKNNSSRRSATISRRVLCMHRSTGLLDFIHTLCGDLRRYCNHSKM